MVLAQGGHAVDAAVAANAVMGVVCPMMCGVGGDLFAIVCEHDGKTARRQRQRMGACAADAAISRERGRRQHAAERRPLDHRAWRGRRLVTAARAIRPHAACAPARACDGPRRRRISGRRDYQRGMAQPGAPFLRNDPEAARDFLPTAAARVRRDLPKRRPGMDLSPDCRATAATAFYRGEVARRLVAGLERRGATMAAADLAEFRAQWAEPISTTYRGWDVFELPPNGAGIAALMMLNIMETLPAFAEVRHDSADALHIDDRGEEARVRRHAAARRRSGVFRRAGARDVEQGVRARARRADRSSQGAGQSALAR